MQTQSNFTIYSASAGSGKTFTLVKEYLKILLKSKNTLKFKQILAVTFTNKAAAEMKSRVVEALHSFSKLESNDILTIISSELNLSEAEIGKKSQKILDTILQNYSAFNIVTIDSFTHNLIKSFALDLKLPLNFDVELDAESLLNEAVDVVISKIGEERELTNLLIDYSIQKLEDNKSWDISLELKEFSKLLLNENNAIYLEEFKNTSISELISFKKELQEKNKKIENEFKELGKSGLEIIRLHNVDHNHFSYGGELPKHFIKLTNIDRLKIDDLKFEGRLNKTITESKNLFATKCDNSIKELIITISDSLKQDYYKSKDLYTLKYSEYILNSLIIEGLTPLAVLSSINNALQKIKTDNNILLNAEFNKIISDTIKNEPAPFIYERIGEKYRYYFIDEMQDTSVLQWENFIPLIENALVSENEFGEKGKLMLVGDAKQSIYRWRGGKPEQFIQLSAKEKKIENNPFYVEKDVFNLSTNFRSYSEIIEFNNCFFKHLSGFLSNKVNEELYFTENDQRITQKKGGFVELSFIEKDDTTDFKDGISTKVLEIINDLNQSFTKSEICILVRTKKQGVEIANYLVENNIEIISSETLLISNNKKIKFIVDLLYSIINPESNHFKIRLLYFLYEHLNISILKHDFLSRFIKLDLNSLFEELKDYDIDFKLSLFNETPFYESFEYIIRAFNLTSTSDANIQFFLDVVFEFQQKKSISILKFVEYWELKKDKLSIVAPENENAIRIMTIHKAKGLEFPVVIYPYDLDIYREKNHKIWYNYKNHSSLNNVLLSYGTKLKYTGEQGERLYNEHREELEFDNFNLLYVAFTRAIEQLYLITEKKVSAKNEENFKFSSGILINYLKNKGLWSNEQSTYQFGDVKRISKKNELSDNTVDQHNYISNSWKSNNILIVSNSSLLWDTNKGESIVYGNLIHEILSKIRTKNDIEDTLNEYVFNGVISEEIKIVIGKTLLSITNHPKLERYYKQECTILNEHEIVSKDKEISIPDRLVFKKNEVVIIDYKTGKPEKKHHNQLKRYGKLLCELGYIIEKKILVYINEEISIEEF